LPGVHEVILDPLKYPNKVLVAFTRAVVLGYTVLVLLFGIVDHPCAVRAPGSRTFMVLEPAPGVVIIQTVLERGDNVSADPGTAFAYGDGGLSGGVTLGAKLFT